MHSALLLALGPVVSKTASPQPIMSRLAFAFYPAHDPYHLPSTHTHSFPQNPPASQPPPTSMIRHFWKITTLRPLHPRYQLPRMALLPGFIMVTRLTARPSTCTCRMPQVSCWRLRFLFRSETRFEKAGHPGGKVDAGTTFLATAGETVVVAQDTGSEE